LTLNNDLFQYIENKSLFAKNILRDLIKIESTTGRETKIQNYVYDLLKSIGCNKVTKITADKEKIKNDLDFIDSGHSYENRPNILGTFSNYLKPAGKSLMFLCHIDTVSPEPLVNWSKNPYGEDSGHFIYGRGACDMKGGFVASILALKSIIDLNYPISGEVKFCSTIEEESGGGGGALAVLLNGYKADGIICPEPELQIAVASAGVCYFRIRVRGKSAHAGKAHRGINVIEKMNIIFDRLKMLDDKRGREVHFPLFEITSQRSCNLNVGVYKAGNWPSTVPGEGYMEGRISFIPGENIEEIHKAIIECTIIDDDEWLKNNPPEVEWFGWQAHPWIQEINNPFIKTFMKCANLVLKDNVQFIGKAAGLDARFCGRFNIPALSFGPSGGNIHGSDEYVEFNSILDCAKVYVQMISKWCG